MLHGELGERQFLLRMTMLNKLLVDAAVFGRAHHHPMLLCRLVGSRESCMLVVPPQFSLSLCLLSSLPVVEVGEPVGLPPSPLDLALGHTFLVPSDAVMLMIIHSSVHRIHYYPLQFPHLELCQISPYSPSLEYQTRWPA